MTIFPRNGTGWVDIPPAMAEDDPPLAEASIAGPQDGSSRHKEMMEANEQRIFFITIVLSVDAKLMFF